MFETHLGNLFPFRRSALSLLSAGVVLSLSACANMHPTGGALTSANQSAVQVKIGDAPADRILSFEVTVGPASLTTDTGATVSLLADAQRIELSHLSGTSAPLRIVKLPQGNFSSATVTIANPEITFLNASGQVQKIQPAFSQTITIPFNPPLAISGPSSVVSVDFNLAKSLTFDAQGNVTGVNLTSGSFAVNSATVADGGRQTGDDGELEDTTGTITAVNGSSFTLQVSQTGASLQFTTDANTRFEDGASLAVSEMVTVEGTTKADGTLYARKVEGIENEHGAEAEGLITTVTGSPATSLTLVMDSASGTGAANAVGNTTTVDVSKAKFVVKEGDVDSSGLGGLPSSEFPFDASTIHAGQRVELDSQGSMSSSGFQAERVRLQQQAIVGTVSGLASSAAQGPVTFTLTATADSAFATLSGKTQITVFWQPGTDLKKLASVSNGDSIRVRGLLFYTGSGFNFVARRITK